MKEWLVNLDRKEKIIFFFKEKMILIVGMTR